MNKNVFIVIYPYKFTEFLWNLVELDELSKFTEVQVWDISRIINPGFANSIAVQSLYRKEVVQIESISALLSQFHSFVKQYKESNICILNEVSKNSPLGLLVELILGFYVKSTDAKVFDQFIGGVPILYPGEIAAQKSEAPAFGLYRKIIRLIKYSTNFKDISFKVSAYTSTLIGKLIPTTLTHRFVAGTAWHDLALKSLTSDTKIIFGHSYDYSNYVASVAQPFVEIDKDQNTAVLLDTPGPLFTSDYELTKRTVTVTAPVWYPALIKYFDFLERKTGVIVEIAGHYKSNHISPAPCFDNRIVKYGMTREMVQRSEYVITRCSTAISYAVLYRKPVVFIYSTQLSIDKEAMRNINGMAEMLGNAPVNIDDYPDDIEKYLKVDEVKYAAYERELLTSDPLGRPNFRIILEDIMGIATQSALSGEMNNHST